MSTLELTKNLATALHEITVAQHAQNTPKNSENYWVLPTWHWAPPLIKIGNKNPEETRNKQNTVVRIHYPGTPQITPQNNPTPVSWHINGLGHNQKGTTPLPNPDLPFANHITQVNANQLNHLTQQGKHARWTLLTHIEQQVEHHLEQAVRAISAELAGPTQPHNYPNIIDKITVEEIRDTLVLGNDSDNESYATRLITRLLNPDTFKNVDIVRWLSVEVKRTCNDAVRQKIGDPRMGPLIRAEYRSSPKGTPLHQFLNDFKAKHPKHRLGVERLVDALTVDAEITARSISFEELEAINGI